ncbi:hypothetical protein BJ965_001896 [Streptomyces luteogriseus]|uniref:Uncharacterized protein n=1 Tax=Streptomyces luteogriseus TaxID=68233 RepID=A0A7W7DJK3_9ACTN|nr:hypothetical protein [Streptomyces luteogriseus]MBB4712014.1 hypothetical protein [Streptomyces luteogriseus]
MRPAPARLAGGDTDKPADHARDQPVRLDAPGGVTLPTHVTRSLRSVNYPDQYAVVRADSSFTVVSPRA